MNEPRAFLMGQTQSPEGPRALAHKLKPLAIPDQSNQPAIFNASHSFRDDLSIIKHLKLTLEKKKERNYKENGSS